MTRAIVLCSVSTPAQAKDDKVSMEQQETDGLAVCERNDWDVADIVRIPGYSRSFYTLAELVEAANSDGEYGPARLQAHIQARDFDVLVARSTNRFGREQSINAEVIGKIIKACGARIYSIMDGMIDRQNYRAYIAITGYRDASEIDELVKKRAIGVRRRAENGLPVSGKVPMSHRVVRDPVTGRDLRLEVRAELRPLFRDVAELLLDGVAYDLLEAELFRRYGYADRDGKAYPRGKFYNLLRMPGFWGNNVIRWQKSPVSKYHKGLWAFDAALSLPPGVEMFWNTHEPMYTGALAEQVQAEMRRRTEVTNAPSLHVGQKALSGLVVCGLCWRRYSYHITERAGRLYVYLRCHSAYRLNGDLEPLCTSERPISEADVRDWLTREIQPWVDRGQVTFHRATAADEQAEQLAALRQRAAALDARLGGLATELALAADDLRVYFRREMQAANAELKRVNDQAAALESDANRTRQMSQSSDAVLQLIREHGMAWLWEQPGEFTNRALRDLLGDYRIVVGSGDIKGFHDITSLE